MSQFRTENRFPLYPGIALVGRLAIGAGLFVLAGCAGGTGEAADGFAFADVAPAYIALRETGPFTERFGAAMTIAPGIAVTNAHNRNLVDPARVVGRAPHEDLLYFRTGRTAFLPVAAAAAGERVIAYGQGPGGGLRKSAGIVHRLGPIAFTIAADAGEGFSGGPVLDAATGRLLGITYGFLEGGDGARKIHLLIAYKMAFVEARLAALKSHTKPMEK